jgi:molybdopterin-guanine dinucleotide biosynthesis protein A
MGGMDKGLVPYQGRALVLYALDALRAHTHRILVNANRNLGAYRELGYPVISDPDPNFRGPLSGILAGMRAASNGWLLTVPCDMPKVTGEILERLLNARECGEVSLLIAHDGERLQPLLMLASTDLAASLQDYLDSGGRRVDLWVETLPHQIVDLSDLRSALVNFNDFEALDDTARESND